MKNPSATKKGPGRRPTTKADIGTIFDDRFTTRKGTGYPLAKVAKHARKKTISIPSGRP